MSLPADFDLKERVRSALDIVDVVGRDLELRPQGRHFVARCPFHNDRRPSMTVNQERQTWKCWVCDIGGDIFSFVMQREGVDFPTALRLLAEQAGIPFEERRSGGGTKPGSPDDKATLLKALQIVCDGYFELLRDASSDDARLARDYLAKRGIDDKNRERFRIGFAPHDWQFSINLLAKHNLSGAVAEAAGVAFQRRSGGFADRFRGRLMFPIYDLQDRPISLGGRIIPAFASREEQPERIAKYINGPETKLFRKSQQLYGLQLARDAIRRGGEAYVMEGYTDVVAARQAGIEPVVAVLGTALGEQHIKLLKRFAERVVLVLDGDAAGQARSDAVTELFVSADVDLRVLTLPSGSDPADFLAERGADAFLELVANAPDALDHRLLRETSGVDLTRDTHRATKALDSMLGLIAKAPGGGGLRKDQLLLRLSRMFGIARERLESQLAEKQRAATRRRSSAPRRRSLNPSPGGAVGRAVDRERAMDPNQMLAESAETGSGDEFRNLSLEATGRGARVDEGLPAVTGIDRELFETLIESPDLAAMAVEAIDPSWLETNTAKMILSAYQDLELDGRALDVDSLMLVIENEPLKNHVVTLQERVHRRMGNATETAESRYGAIVTHYREREFAIEKNRQIARLESRELGEDEELALLKELFEAERFRLGIHDRSSL